MSKSLVGCIVDSRICVLYFLNRESYLDSNYLETHVSIPEEHRIWPITKHW